MQASFLCEGLFPGLGTMPSAPGGFRDWLRAGQYTPDTIEEGNIQLNNIPISEISPAISFDYERFALSSRESFFVALSEKESHQSLGWPLLKTYYSSFFAAHSIMRSRGGGVSKIDGAAARHLGSLINTYNPSFKDNIGGMYAFYRNRDKLLDKGEASIILYKIDGGQGVHESFWKEFFRFLDREAEIAVQIGAPSSSEFVTFAHDLRTAATLTSEDSSWLSRLRNQINYQHDFESWMPYTKKSRSFNSFPNNRFKDGDTIRLDVSKRKKPVEAFLNACRYISSVSFYISEHIAHRSSRGGTFGQKWRRICESLAG